MLNKICIVLVILIKFVSSTENPVIELPTGKVLGLQASTFSNTSFYAFQKIPYAVPPVGPLRFKAPRPVQSWNGTLNTTLLDIISCYQQGIDLPFESEDCLFLNVYTPMLPTENETSSLPVMLFIHGGTFIIGWSQLAPPDLYVDNDVILVTINYRLGVFGFLSTEDEVIPGNNGLKDQQMAIQWTYENIHLFGGDPTKITIFGESAGSVSVAYQLLNQNSKGLFQGAIMESGSFLCDWSYQKNARKTAFATAATLNTTFSTSNDSKALLEFLQGVDAKDLDAAAQQNQADGGSTFAPVIEVKNPDAFITKKMYGLLKAGNILRVPVIIGINSEESIYFLQDPTALQSVLETWDDNLNLIVPNNMRITDSKQHAEMAQSIRDIYTNGEPFGTHLGNALRLTSDDGFNRPIIKHVELSSIFSDTYFYQFSYDGLPGNIFVHYDGADSVGHTEELSYLFTTSYSNFQESDKVTSQRLIELWTNFAKYQNPTPESSELLQEITWPKVSVESGDFLYLDINENLEIKNHPKAETFTKWDILYQSLNFTDFDTY